MPAHRDHGVPGHIEADVALKLQTEFTSFDNHSPLTSNALSASSLFSSPSLPGLFSLLSSLFEVSGSAAAILMEDLV